MALTPRTRIPYPNEDSDPWFNAFESMLLALDSSIYAAREDRNAVFTSEASFSFTASSGVLSWNNPITIFSPITGYYWLVPAGSAVLAAGQALYITITRNPQTSNSYTTSVGTIIPSDVRGDDQFILCVRIGNRIYFRNGAFLTDGDSRGLFGTISIAGTGLVKAIAGVLPSTASLLVNADVDAAAAIAGTKISPDFGAQNITTTGIVSLGPTPAVAGKFRLANNPGVVVSQRNGSNTNDIPVLAANATEAFLGTDTSYTLQSVNARVYASSAVYSGVGSTTITLLDSTGLQLNDRNFSLGASPTYGGGSIVAFLKYATTNPTTNPTGGIVAYVDSVDGFLKYRKVDGTVVNLNGVGSPFTVTGTGLLKAVGGTIQTAATLLVDADVNATAAIAGTKINPDFGSQNIVTTGSITARTAINYVTPSGGIGAASTDGITLASSQAASGGTPVMLSGRQRWSGYAWNSSGSVSEQHEWINEAVPVTNAGATTSYLRFSRQISGGGYSDVARFGSDGSFSLGTSPASAGIIRLGGTGSVDQIVWSDGSNRTIVNTNTSGSVVTFGNTAYVSVYKGNTVKLTALNADALTTDVNGNVTFPNTINLASGTFSTTGLIRTANNPGIILAQRNNGNSANLTFLAASATDLYVGCDTAGLNASTNVRLYPTTAVLFGSSNTTVGQFDTTNGWFNNGYKITWNNTYATPRLMQDDLTTASGTGNPLTIQAQNETGTTSTGGALNLTSGTGTSTHGALNLQIGGTSKFSIAADSSNTITSKATVFIENGNAKLTDTNVKANIQTTDATVTNLYTWTIPAGISSVDIVVTGIKSDSTQGATYKRSVTFLNNAGTVSIIGAVIDNGTTESDAAWDCTIANTTTTGQVKVTGKITTTITWTLSQFRHESIV